MLPPHSLQFARLIGRRGTEVSQFSLEAVRGPLHYFERNELRARLTVGRRILALQDGLIHAREELPFQATHDVLTGIWNRRALLDLLQREIERASRSNSSTALLMLDLDHFKEVNDIYGHAAGTRCCGKLRVASCK